MNLSFTKSSESELTVEVKTHKQMPMTAAYFSSHKPPIVILTTSLIHSPAVPLSAHQVYSYLSQHLILICQHSCPSSPQSIRCVYILAPLPLSSARMSLLQNLSFYSKHPACYLFLLQHACYLIPVTNSS